MPKTVALDQLQPVQELNRAFLGLLQTRVRQHRECFGLPAVVRPALLSATGTLLDGVACFPRALFQLHLAGRLLIDPTAPAGDFDEPEHALCLSVLLAARLTSRLSTYQARLLFGLGIAEVARLAAAQLAELQRLAATPGVLACSFADRVWFWHGLLTATRPELRRQLTLMALQPPLALGWPQRRPPHASA